MGYTPVNAPFAEAAAAQNRQALKNVVQNINLLSRRENTAKAYDPKASEYYKFCDHKYGGQHESGCYTVTSAKLYEFLFYQSMRSKYSRGGKNRSAHGFDPNDFDMVVKRYAEYQVQYDKGQIDEIPDPEDPVGYDTINTALSWKRFVNR